MSFQAKTDYFDLADDSTIVIVSSDENKSSTVIQARDEKGDVVAQEIVGITTAPSCSYVIKSNASTGEWKIGLPIVHDDKKYTISSIQINTGAGTPPSLQVSGEEVPATSHEDCYYDIPSATVKVCHHAQILWGAFTFTEGTGGCYLTQANYTASGSLTKAQKDGETISYDISEGKIEAALTFVSTTGTKPTLTPGSGWTFTQELTKSEPDSDYNSYTCTLTKNLVHHTT